MVEEHESSTLWRCDYLNLHVTCTLRVQTFQSNHRRIFSDSLLSGMTADG